MQDKKEQQNKEIIDVVVARLETMPMDMRMAIGDKGQFDRNELINHVKRCDDIGKTIVDMQLFYLRSLKKGIC